MCSLACPQDNNNLLGGAYFTISLKVFCDTEAFGLFKVRAVWQQGTITRSTDTLTRSGAGFWPWVQPLGIQLAPDFTLGDKPWVRDLTQLSNPHVQPRGCYVPLQAPSVQIADIFKS